ncbi:hypothetical protein Sste5346_007182 [Sporothrix stenoceras]|uniref:Uncharacterized protein n=1 Tax=Sporothrix stenoceras TaxID=5173 RepID=A0ABR3YWG3_9PEZI
MSVFSIIRRARQAKEQPASKPSNKQLGKQKEEQATPRYVHVPTHAAADALMGAPAGWMRDDAERIRENNMKRNAMAAAAAQPIRLPRSGSSAMLSPLHIDMHAGSSSSGGRRYGNASTTALNKRASQWSQSPSSRSLRRSSSTPGTLATFSPPNFSSLDEELFRARISPLEASQNGSYASQSTAAASISPAPSSTSSSPRSSPSSSPSTSPSMCSTPSFGPHGNSKSKGVLSYFTLSSS